MTRGQIIRKSILDMVYNAGSGHLGGSLSAVELLIALYDDVMRYDPNNPKWEERDRLILSKGHAAPALYAILADKGFFLREELKSLRRLGSILQGHPDMRKTPGVDFSSGSLGQGLSVGLGISLALRKKRINSFVYVLMGDGELNEGQIWEAALAAPKYEASHLIGIIDRNHVQLDGRTDEILPLDPLKNKWEAFNWNVLMTDGHDVDMIIKTLREAGRLAENTASPTVIIAETVKGKGVPYMEGRYEWHGGLMSQEDYKAALIAVMNGESI